MLGIVDRNTAVVVGTGHPRQPTQARVAKPDATRTMTQAEPLSDAYCNTTKQHMKGITNQTGYVKGNANGVINFGSLMAFSSTQSQRLA